MVLSDPGSAVTYAEWLAAVTAAGGHRTNMPHAAPVANVSFWDMATWFGSDLVTPNIVVAAYPASVWVAKVNALEWTQPDDFSADGQTGYYRAPDAVQKDAVRLGAPTPNEIAHGQQILLDKWYESVKGTLGVVGAGLLLAAVTAAVGYAVVKAIASKK